MEWHPYTEQRPGVMLGKPVIKGTRLTVEYLMAPRGARKHAKIRPVPVDVNSIRLAGGFSEQPVMALWAALKQ